MYRHKHSKCWQHVIVFFKKSAPTVTRWNTKHVDWYLHSKVAANMQLPCNVDTGQYALQKLSRRILRRDSPHNGGLPSEQCNSMLAGTRLFRNPDIQESIAWGGPHVIPICLPMQDKLVVPSSPLNWFEDISRPLTSPTIHAGKKKHQINPF